MLFVYAFLFCASAFGYTSADYVQEGLIGHWDGIENVGVGIHSNTTNIWKDLVGNRDFTLTANGSWSASGKSLSVKGLSATAASAGPAYKTIEVVYRMTKSGRILFSCGGDKSRVVIFDGDGTKGYFDGSATTKYVAWTLDPVVRRSMTCVYGDDGKVADVYGDGELQNDGTHANTWNAGSVMSIGDRYESSYPWYGEVFAIRLYSTALTAEQIAANQAIDQARFSHIDSSIERGEAVGGVVATGGTVKRVYNDFVHTFTNSGTFSVTKPGTVQVLVVGGGGGGGMDNCSGGGGAGGGVIYQESFAVSAGDYAIVVGEGGEGSTNRTADTTYLATHSQGRDSSISFGGTILLAAKGGGWGGNYYCYGGAGGSGGGGVGYWNGTTAPEGNTRPGAGTEGSGDGQERGNYGGRGYSTGYVACWSGGGGGAGGKGVAGANKKAGNGGAGVSCDISGATVYYGAGGGGGTASATSSEVGSGGKGGGKGGYFDSSSNTGTDGAAGESNVGGGGGGGGGNGTRNAYPNGKGGKGGSGIVIIRYAIDMEDVEPTFARIEGGVKTKDGDYQVHAFTADDTFTVEGTSLVDVLVVGGGGGGGCSPYGGGGGGAGGVVYLQSYIVTGGVYQVTVGDGGVGGRQNPNEASYWETLRGTNGEDSAVFDIVAKGGGRGASGGENGDTGGSGGGGTGHQSATLYGGSGTSGQGNAGGKGSGTSPAEAYAGGGGGAGAVGGDYVAGSKAGDGGMGIACSITGVQVYYGGGGGGGSSSASSSAYGDLGTGGGGKGGRMTTSTTTEYAGQNGGNGTANTGGGGGGGGGGRGSYPNGIGGKGGSGVVIIRCRQIQKGLKFIIR